MCGIVGYISKDDKVFANAKRHFMHFALTLDTLRGRDSTGLIEVYGKRFNQQMHRTLVPGDRWVHTKEFEQAWRPAWAMVGHNRAATAGSVILENAHPFQFGPIRLVHNGTLWNDGKQFDTHDPGLAVDSMQIANALSKVDPGEAVSVLEKIDGSFAVVWTDERDKSINMARNMDRPLHIGVNPEESILWFMSDGVHLHSINNSLYKSGAKANSIYLLDKNKMLKYKKGSLVPEVTEFDPFDYRAASRSKQSQSETKSTQSTNGAWPKPNTYPKGKEPSSTSRRRLGEIQIEVAGKRRKLLPKHAGLLRSEFDLGPTEILRFQPMEKISQRNGRYTIIGEVYLPDWDCWWEAVAYDVQMATVNAYEKYTWLVNATGVCRSWVPDDTPQPSIIVTFYKVLVKGNETVPEKEAQDDPKGQTVQMGKERIAKNEALALLSRGCLTCEQPLSLKDGPSVTIVNGGRDVLCMGCREDLNSRVTRAALSDDNVKSILH